MKEMMIVIAEKRWSWLSGKKTRKNKMVMLEIIVGKNKTREKEKQIVIAECVEKKSNYGWNDVKRRKEKK